MDVDGEEYNPNDRKPLYQRSRAREKYVVVNFRDVQAIFDSLKKAHEAIARASVYYG